MMDDYSEDNEGLLSNEPSKFKRNKNQSWWNTFWSGLPYIFFFSCAVLGLAAFIQINTKWDDIKSIHQECKPQKVNEFMLTERIFDTKRTDWPSWSKTLQGSRYNPHVKVSSHSVRRWQNICGNGTRAYAILNTEQGVSTTITSSYDLNMFFAATWPYFNGTGARLYGFNATTCDVIWEITAQSLGIDTVPGNDAAGVDNPEAAVRTSLTVFTNRTGGINVIFGDLGTTKLYNTTASCINSTVCGARIYSLEGSTGKLLWRTLVVEPSPITGYFRQSDIITSSPTVIGSEAIFGVSSTQSGDVTTSGSLDFYGRYFSIDINDGSILWIHRTNSDAQIAAGNYGSAAWGSNPPYDYESQQLFFGTGNLYNYSLSVLSCLQTGHTRQYCTEEGIINDSVFGLRINNDGQRSWIFSPIGVDAWVTACLSDPVGTYCPAEYGPDYDFGTGGVIIENQCGQRFLIALSKSGILYSFDVDTRDIKWATYIAPGSSLVPSWGMSFDGEKIYFSIGNFGKRSFLMLDGTLRCDGVWVAVDAWSGRIEWMTSAPCSRASEDCPSQVPFYDTDLVGLISEDQLTYADRKPQKAGAAAPCYGTASEDIRNAPNVGATISGGVITTRNLMFGGSYTGYMHVFNKENGKIIYDLPRCTTGIIYGSASISLLQDNNQILTWGCGYGRIDLGFPQSYGSNETMIVRLPYN